MARRDMSQMGEGFHLGCELSKSLSNAVGALGESRELEDPHGTVPDDGLGIAQGVLEGLQGVWADVQTLQRQRPPLGACMQPYI